MNLPDITIYSEQKLQELYKAVAQQLINTVKLKPQAFIVLSASTAFSKIYPYVIEQFEQDKKLDFSQAHFLLLNDYLDLKKDHPLTGAIFTKHYFYQPLRQIELERAPQVEHCYFDVQDKEYLQKIKSSKFDLTILEIGGAYPAQINGACKLLGGCLGFNQPGANADAPTGIVDLSSETRKQDGFRFESLVRINRESSKLVPSQAFTIGLKDILSSKEIIAIAIGEATAPVLKHAFESPPLP